MEEEEVEVDGGDEQGKEAVEGPAFPHSSRHLGKVPIAALIRFKTVSKDWSALIGEPYSMRMTRHGYCPEKIHDDHTHVSYVVPIFPTMGARFVEAEFSTWEAQVGGIWQLGSSPCTPQVGGRSTVF